MQQYYEDREFGTVTLNESRRARHISVRISGSDNSLRLTYPTSCSQKRAIEALDKLRENIRRKREALKVKKSIQPPASSFDQAELIKRAKEYLPQRVAMISAQTQLKYNRVTIRKTRNQWGSCSSADNISLSSALMILPEHLIDFVIIHELCHTVHRNHSDKFHKLVDYICQGEEKRLNRELKSYSIK